MFLVISSHPDLRNNGADLLFSGEGCRDRPLRPQDRLLPYPWDDRKKYHEDFYSLLATCERYLIDLRQKLNLLHGENRSLRYWRIVLGPWLNYFIPVLFDRYQSIVEAEKTNLVRE